MPTRPGPQVVETDAHEEPLAAGGSYRQFHEFAFAEEAILVAG